jgi:hypothetical protein
MPYKYNDDNHKTILPRMWSTDHIANYMNFTTAPAFRTPAYPYEEDLAKYGIDASKLSEADYNRAIGQLK